MQARHCFHTGPPYGPTAGQISPLLLGQLIVARRVRHSVLQQVRVYRGMPDATREPRPYAANERQTAAWGQSPLIEVIRRPLRYPGSWPKQRAREKGVDVALGIDFVRLAVRGAHEVGVLVSTDTDLVPALEAALEIKTVGVHIEVVRGGPRAPTSGLASAGNSPGAISLTKLTTRRSEITATTTRRDRARPARAANKPMTFTADRGTGRRTRTTTAGRAGPPRRCRRSARKAATARNTSTMSTMGPA